MASIDISRSHKLSKEDAKSKAEALAKELEGEIGIKWKWEGDSIKFDAPSGAAKGVKGAVHVEASAVRVEVDLPFLLKAIKGTIEGKINKKLETTLG